MSSLPPGISLPRGPPPPRPMVMPSTMMSNNNNNNISSNMMSNMSMTMPSNMSMPTMMSNSTPPIFKNHFECPKNMNKNDVLYEVSLGAGHQIEGIHVVPNNTIVVDFEGRTKPDLNGGPFNLIMYGRNIETNTIVILLELQVHGGIMWAPIYPQHKLNINIDYLAFCGDFDALSIIVHGTVLVDSTFSEDQIMLIKSGFPSINTDNDDDYDEDDDTNYNNLPGIEILLQNFNNSMPIDRQEVCQNLEYLRTTTATLQNRLMNISNDVSIPNSLIDYALSKSPLSSKCRVSVNLIAEIVGAIFAFDDVNAFASTPIQQQASILLGIGEKLIECYQGVYSLDHSIDVASLDASLGEEVATLIVSFLIKVLEVLLFNDNTEVITDPMTLELVSNSTFLCCKAVLMNEFTADAFVEAGGIKILYALVRQEPRLPSIIVYQVINCISYAVLHSRVVTDFISPPPASIDEYGYSQTDLSGYQIILTIAENIGRTSSAFSSCKSIFNWCSLAGSCSELHKLSSSIAPALSEIVDAISWQISKYVNVINAGEEEIVDSRVHVTAAKLDELLNSIEDKLQSLQIALSTSLSSRIFSSGNTINTNNNDIMNAAIVSLLTHYKFLPAVVTIISALKLGSELHSVLDWSEDKTDILYNKLERIKILMLRVLCDVLKVDGIDIMISSEISTVQILWKIIAHDEHVLSCPPIQELFNLPLNSRGTAQLLYPSLGWSFWLLYKGCVVIDKILSTDEESLNTCLEELIELSSSCVGASAISIIVLKYILPKLLQLLKEDVSSNPVGRALAESASTLLQMCIRQVDIPIVADILMSSRASIISSLQENNELSMSLDMRSQDMIAQIRYVLKTLNSTSISMEDTNSNYYWLSTIERVHLELPYDCTYMQMVSFASGMVSNISTHESKSTGTPTDNIDQIIIFRQALTSICKLFQLVETKTFKVASDNKSPVIAMLQASKNLTVAEFFSPEYTSQLSEKQAKFISDSVILDFTFQEFHLLHSLFSLLTLLHDAINLDIESCNFKYKSVDFIDELININAFALRLAGRNRTGELGSLVRLINVKCTKILSLYCLSKLGLVTHLCRKGMSSPSLFYSCLMLISNLIPDTCYNPNSGSTNIKYTEYEMDMSRKWEDEIWKKTSSKSFLYDRDVYKDAIVDKLLDRFKPDANKNDDKNKTQESSALVDIILTAVISSSRKVNRLGLILCKKVIVLGETSSIVVASMITKKLHQYAMHMLHLQTLSANDKKDDYNDDSAILSLCRILSFVNDLCMSKMNCLAFVQEGLLHSVFACVQSINKDIVILGIQCIMTITRTLSQVCSQLNNEITILMEESYTSMSTRKDHLITIAKVLETCLSSMGNAIVPVLATTVSRFQESKSGTLVWMQLILCMSLLQNDQIKHFISSLSPTVAIEVISVKVWLAFEDAFQMLIEATEVHKAALAARASDDEFINFLGNDEGVGVVKKAHIQLAGSVMALKSVLDIVLDAYYEGHITTMTLQKAIRASLGDPMKVAQRFQRTYTIWNSQQAQYEKSIVKSQKGNPNETYGTDSSGSGSINSTTFVFTGRIGIEESWVNNDDSFGARHTIIETCLKSVVGSVKRAKNLIKEGRPTDNVPFEGLPPTQIDLIKPFASHNSSDSNGTIVSLWYQAKLDNYTSRLGNAGALYNDTLQDIYRRNLDLSSSPSMMSLKCIQNIVRKNIVRDAEQASKRPKVYDPYHDNDHTNNNLNNNFSLDNATGLALRGLPRQQLKNVPKTFL